MPYSQDPAQLSSDNSFCASTPRLNDREQPPLHPPLQGSGLPALKRVPSKLPSCRRFFRSLSPHLLPLPRPLPPSSKVARSSTRGVSSLFPTRPRSRSHPSQPTPSSGWSLIHRCNLFFGWQRPLNCECDNFATEQQSVMVALTPKSLAPDIQPNAPPAPMLSPSSPAIQLKPAPQDAQQETLNLSPVSPLASAISQATAVPEKKVRRRKHSVSGDLHALFMSRSNSCAECSPTPADAQQETLNLTPVSPPAAAIAHATAVPEKNVRRRKCTVSRDIPAMFMPRSNAGSEGSSVFRWTQNRCHQSVYV